MRRVFIALFVTVLLLAVPVGIALSIPNTTWNKYEGNPILYYSAPPSFDDFNVYAVDVMYLPDRAKYYMWYSGTSFTRNNKEIGFATSDDGIRWDRYVGNPVLPDGPAGYWDYGRVNAPSVFYDEAAGVWKMWYTGYTGYFAGSAVGYATSRPAAGAPPLTWEKFVGYVFTVGPEFINELNTSQAVSAALRQRFEQNGITLSQDAQVYVRTVDVAWEILDDVDYLIQNENGVLNVYDMATYDDTPGLVFDSVGDSQSFDGYNVFAPDVLKLNGVYHMWYTGNGGTIPQNQIGYATSPDGIHWERYIAPGQSEAQPVLPVGGPGAWDEGEVASPSVLQIGSELHMYYQGSNRDLTRSGIGRAVSTDGGKTWVKDGANPLLEGSATAGAWDLNRLFYPSVVQNGAGDLYMWFHARSRNSDLTPFKLGVAFGENVPIIMPTPTPTLLPGVTPTPTPGDPGFLMLPIIQRQ